MMPSGDVTKSLEEGRGYNSQLNEGGHGALGRLATFGLGRGGGRGGIGGGAKVGATDMARKRATGIYAAVLTAQRSKRAGHLFVSVLIYASHFVQIIVGASLTAL